MKIKTLLIIIGFIFCTSLVYAGSPPPGFIYNSDTGNYEPIIDGAGLTVEGSVSVGAANSTEATDKAFWTGNIENDAATPETITGGQLFLHLSDETDGSEDTYLGINQLVAGVQSKAYFYKFAVTLADGAQLIMPTALSGFGTVYVIDDDDYAAFTFVAAGDVTLQDTTGGATPTTTEDNDTTLNIFDNGSGIGFENELGSEKILLIDMTFIKP